MIRYARERNIGTVISTNLNIRRDGFAEEVVESGIEHLEVSLDGTDVEILDANVLRLGADETARRSLGFDIVGLSLLTPVHNFAVEVVRRLPSHVMKVAGGLHACGVPEELLHAGFDAVVAGEGEGPLSELCAGRPLGEIRGPVFRRDHEIIRNEARPFMDVDALPFPARHLLTANGVNRPYYSSGTERFPWAPHLSSRGCPYGCYYCNRMALGRRFRARSPELVVEEIASLVEQYGIRELDIVDDSFNIDIARAKRIFDLLVERRFGLTVRFPNGIKADAVDRELISKAKVAGFNYIAYGVESGNQTVSDLTGKSIRLEAFREAVRLTKEFGINVTAFFILGFIEDTTETMEQTIRFAKELDTDFVNFAIATPYPGARFYEKVKANGELLYRSWDECFHTTGRMLYRYPGAPDARDVERAYRRAFRAFFFRPSFVYRHVLRKDFFRRLPILLRGLKALLQTQFERKGRLRGSVFRQGISRRTDERHGGIRT
ncbi:MAG: radical SAM protein [bacterium]|nr:radical SAM protein [bacterium]